MEGNTTLYALPKAEIVDRWYAQTTDDFPFCFKFPATISHRAALRHCDDLVQAFLPARRRWKRVLANTGCSCPPPDRAISPPYGSFLMRPRHVYLWRRSSSSVFFDKGEDEQRLNRGLHARGVNRVIPDSRPVHAAHPHSEAVRDAQRNPKFRYMLS